MIKFILVEEKPVTGRQSDNMENEDENEVRNTLNDETIEVIQLTRNFLNGDLDSGDILFAKSANCNSNESIAIDPCLQVLQYVIDEERGGGKCAIALGIVANLMVFLSTREKIFMLNNALPNSVINCLLEETDPSIYCEAFRLLSNIVYYDLFHIIAEYIENLFAIVRFTLNNSLDAKLLTQIFQFLHFTLDKFSSSEVHPSQQQWLHQHFDIKTIVLELLTENQSAIYKVSQEAIGSTNGLEFFLSFLNDSMQSMRTMLLIVNANEDLQKSYDISVPAASKVLLNLVCGPDVLDDDDVNDFSPVNVNQKFSVLSSLEILLRNATEKERCIFVRLFCERRNLVSELLDLTEMAILMRNIESILSVSFVGQFCLQAVVDRRKEWEEVQANSRETDLKYLEDSCKTGAIINIKDWIHGASSLISLLLIDETNDWLKSCSEENIIPNLCKLLISLKVLLDITDVAPNLYPRVSEVSENIKLFLTKIQ